MLHCCHRLLALHKLLLHLCSPALLGKLMIVLLAPCTMATAVTGVFAEECVALEGGYHNAAAPPK